MTNFVSRFVKDESGATAIEYGLIAALVAVALIGVLGTFSTALKDKFTAMSTALGNAGTTPAAPE